MGGWLPDAGATNPNCSDVLSAAEVARQGTRCVIRDRLNWELTGGFRSEWLSPLTLDAYWWLMLTA